MEKSFTLITGASEGIGLELAKLFARDKHNLIIVARNEDKLKSAKEFLENEYRVQVEVLSVDLSMDNCCEKVYEFVEKNNLIVDNLINNAGIGSFGFFHDENQEFEKDIININIIALTRLTNYFLKQMIKRRSGNILNVSSTAAFSAGPKMGIYYATKAYVLSLTEAIHEEAKTHNVNVCCLCPGAVNTAFQEKAKIKKKENAKKLIMNSEIVAQIGYNGLKKKEAIIIPGAKNKFLVLGNKLISRKLARRIVMKTNKD